MAETAAMQFSVPEDWLRERQDEATALEVVSPGLEEDCIRGDRPSCSWMTSAPVWLQAHRRPLMTTEPVCRRTVDGECLARQAHPNLGYLSPAELAAAHDLEAGVVAASVSTRS